MENDAIIGPQPGPQTEAMKSKAEILIFGGAAGGGKTFGLLLEMLRHWNNPKFGAVIFRRVGTQISSEGGLWDQSEDLYGPMGAIPRASANEWTFPAGGNLKFSHMEHEKDRFNWQGSQIAIIGFDELTHFAAKQFWYMLSRNRSMSGIRPYMRATCNPDPDSFVRELIDWWIGENGYAIPERSGIIRWFIRPENKLIWSDTKEELEEKYGIDERPKSLTFIPSRLEDNKILMEKDPAYKGNLMKLGKVERERLLGGNWNIRATAGTMFRREWFPIIDDIPPGWMDVGRGWDRAATPPNTENTNPDWTRGVKLYKYPDGTWVVADLRSAQDTPGKILSLIKTIASHDGSGVRIIAQQDPGSAGVDEMERFIKELVGYRVASRPSQKKKEIRATGVAAQAEHGFVKVLRAPWNKEFFDELEAFPDPNAHDDIVDALSAIFNELVGEITVFDNMSGFRGLLG